MSSKVMRPKPRGKVGEIPILEDAAYDFDGSYVIAGEEPIGTFTTSDQVYRVQRDGTAERLTDFTVPDTMIQSGFASSDGSLFLAAGQAPSTGLWRYMEGSQTALEAIAAGSTPCFDLASWRDDVFLSGLEGLRAHVCVAEDSGSPTRLLPESTIDPFDLEVEGDPLFLLRNE